jgi:hypothetical protein
MKFLRLAGVLLILVFCQPVFAQMKESIDVRISTDQKIDIENEQYIASACAEAELLLFQGCFGEAANAFSGQILRFSAEKNQAGLDRACKGLFRAQFLSKQIGLHDEALSLCRPDIVDPLLSKAELEPMFVTKPVFKPSESWLNTATPGNAYKVFVEFDIDEFGKADNFVFDGNIGYYLKFPVLDALKKANYLPAMQDGKPVKRSKNVVEVTFCLDRQTSCGD